jgi:outer membrane protein assembly factor BamB
MLISLNALMVGCQSNSRQQMSTMVVPAQSFVRDWGTNLPVKDRDSITDLFIRGDTIFAYSKNNFAYAVNRTSGQFLYYNPITSSTTTLYPPVLLSDRVIYPCSESLEIYTLQGRKMDTIALGYSLSGPAVGKGERIFVGNTSGVAGRFALVDVDREYGNTRWELETLSSVTAAPALYQGMVFIGCESGRLYAVDDDRSPVWNLEGGYFQTYGPIVADVKADDFGVYVASKDYKLYCLDRASGKVKWQYFGASALTTSPAVTKELVYQYSSAGIAAIDKRKGEYNRKPRWIAADAVQFLAEDSQYSYLRRKDNVIMAVDKTSGETVFTSKRSDFTLFASNTESDMIYAANAYGNLMAIRPVLRPGTVGEIVLDTTPVLPEAVVMAN